jgi:hypothetical protein
MKLVGPLAARSPGLRLALALEIERHCCAPADQSVRQRSKKRHLTPSSADTFFRTSTVLGNGHREPPDKNVDDDALGSLICGACGDKLIGDDPAAFLKTSKVVFVTY